MDKETIAVYDRQVDDYVELTTKVGPDKSLRLFMDRLPKGGRVLDLGCGPGASSAAMKDGGFDVDPLDASGEMVRTANELYNIGARQGVFQDIDSVDFYDGVWANFSLLHASEAEFIEILPQLHRALKPAGLLYLGLKTGAGEIRDKLGRRYMYYSEARLAVLLSAARFKIVASKTGEGIGLAGDVAPFVLITCEAVN